jgi:hypothetical protein
MSCGIDGEFCVKDELEAKLQASERALERAKWLIERLAATVEHASMRLGDAKRAGYPAIIDEARATLLALASPGSP